MSTYSTSLFVGPVLPSPYIAYTAPSGVVIVLRDCEFYNGGAVPTTCNLNLLRSGSFAGVAVWANNVPAGGFAQWEGRVVLEAGDQLQSGVTVSGVRATLSGYTLSPP